MMYILVLFWLYFIEYWIKGFVYRYLFILLVERFSEKIILSK